MISIVTWLVMDGSFHSALLPKPSPYCTCMAQDGEGALWFQPFPVSSRSFLGRHLCEVTDAVIAAEHPTTLRSRDQDHGIFGAFSSWYSPSPARALPGVMQVL